MGPDSTGLPNRPPFSWDIKNVPWTDGIGNQEEYSNSVALWNAFQNKLPDLNSNKIPSELRGIMLQSQLYGRARDLCKGIPDTEIQSDTGSVAIVKAVYKRDALSVVSEVYENFISLLNTKHGFTETFKTFESRFEAQVSKFNASSDAAKIANALTAFMLLAISSVETSQRVSVLAAASPSDSALEGTAMTTDQFLNSISYTMVASVLRQCDQVKNSDGYNSSAPLSALTATTGQKQPQGRSGRGRRTLTPEQLADVKSRSTSYQWQEKGHWKSDHNKDGSLKPSVKSVQSNPRSTNVSKSPGSAQKNTVTFHMVQFTNNYDFAYDFFGPLLDDGAPYSGMGLSEFLLLQPMLIPNWDGSILPVPREIEACPFWQYGSGEHSSEPRNILGSVLLNATTDQRSPVYIRHLIIEGSSHWVVCRNVTRHCNIVHIDDNKIVFPKTRDSISLVDLQFHSHIPYGAFLGGVRPCSEDMSKKLCCATAGLSNETNTRPWSEIKKIVDKVHKHVCGHSTYPDIKILLDRNNLWNTETNKYLSSVLEKCSSCATTAQPKGTRKVSLKMLSRDFNAVV